MPNTTLNFFQSGEILRADELNSAFASVLAQSALRTGFLSEAGLFRPWILPESSPCNDFALDFVLNPEKGGLRAAAVAALLPSGEAVFIENPRLQHFPPHHVAYLTPRGELRAEAAESLPKDAFPLVRRTGRERLEVVACIAALDADQGLADSDRAARKAAAEWREALERGGLLADLPLADAADEAAVAPELGRKIRLDVLRRLARTLARRMTAKGIKNAKLAALCEAVDPVARPEILAWLNAWGQLFGDEALRSNFLGEEDWRAPAKIEPGRSLTGLREARFDLSGGGAGEVEIFSASGFAQGRWRFGEAGEERGFEEARQTKGGWRARVKKPSAAKSLHLWIDSPQPENLRVRLIGKAGGDAA